MRRYWQALLLGLAPLVLSACGGTQLIPSPNLYVSSDENPFAEVPEELQNNEVDVLYVTDRRPVYKKDERMQYDFGRSASMAFGSAVVHIGEDVSWDELVAASRTDDRDVSLPINVAEVTEKGRFPPTPFPYEFSDKGQGRAINYDRWIVGQHKRVSKALHDDLRDRLALTPRKEVYVFVHGYNNSFDSAVSVIAELWHFMGRQGVPIVYTWPAGLGGLRGYFYDRESGEFTIFHLKEFLRILSACEEIEKIHLVAHSRGTDVLMTSLREMLIELGGVDWVPSENRKLGNVIVAAPDLDMEVISQRISTEEIAAKIDRLTVYMSKSDTAIGLSTWLFVSQKRVGRIGEGDFNAVAAQRGQSNHQRGVHLINSEVDSGFIGHSYFYSHPAVLSDVILTLRDNLDPGEENGRPLKPLGHGFWLIDNDYAKSPEE